METSKSFFVVKRYEVCNAKIMSHALRRLKIKQYAVLNGGGGGGAKVGVSPSRIVVRPNYKRRGWLLMF